MIKEITVFGTRFIHKPKLDKVSMRINGFEYTQTEVLEALERKGYNIVSWTYHWQDETFPNGKTNEVAIVKCALKTGEEPSEDNIWYTIAEKVFKKVNYKPTLE